MLCLLLTVWFVKVGLNCKGSKAEEFPVACSLWLSLQQVPICRLYFLMHILIRCLFHLIEAEGEGGAAGVSRTAGWRKTFGKIHLLWKIQFIFDYATMSKYSMKSEGLFSSCWQRIENAPSCVKIAIFSSNFASSKQMLQVDFGARDEAQAKQIDKWKGKPCNRFFPPSTSPF